MTTCTINRKCIITRVVKDRKEMFRINITKNKVVSLDLHQSLQGRGYYVSKDTKVIDRASKALTGMLKTDIDQSIFDQMKSNL